MSDQDYNYIKVGELENKSVLVSREENIKQIEELYKLTKEEQVKILKQKGIKEKDIPQYEKGRVDKIIELKGGGN